MRQLRVPLLAAAIPALLLTSCGGEKPSYPIGKYNMGDKVQVGHIIYTAFETQWLTQIPQDPTPRVPKHRFFLIRLSAVNGGAGDAVLPTLTIHDDHGAAYEELSNGEGVPQWIGFLRQVKPADSIQGYVVFDAPPAHYKLRVADENEERIAMIDIPLSFGAETPEVPIPEAKKDNN